MLIDGTLDRKCVRHFPERALDRFLVLGQYDLLIDLADPERRMGAGIENGHANLRTEGPGIGPGTEEAGKGRTGCPHQGGQGNPREKGRAGNSDIGVGRLQLMLGRHDVRSAQQDQGRETRINLPGRSDAAQVFRQQLTGNLRAGQEIQCVFILGRQLCIDRHIPLGQVHLGLNTPQIQLCRQPRVKLLLDEIIERLLGLQGGVRQLELFAGSSQSHVGLTNSSHQ